MQAAAPTDPGEPDPLQAQYRRRFGAEQAARAAVWQVLVDSWFSRYLTGAEAVLDLGCGWGDFINRVEAPRRHAIDLNPDARRHLDPGVELSVQRASDPWPLGDGSVDVVFTSNFLEHLPSREAITATLAEAHRCLRPSGRLVCLGPNVRYAPGRYWDFFDHIVPLTDRSLVEAVELGGFAVEEAVARFLPWSMAGRPPPPAWAIRAYLRFRPAWRLLGRQFLVVARKPG
jgi:SAM-dependent methyltransferase